MTPQLSDWTGPVPLLDVKAQTASLRAELLEAVTGVLDSAAFVLGPEVAELETELAQRLGVPHVVSCASGSDALVLALMALGVGPGDEVLVPSYTFFATASAASRVGATPVFADIDPATYNLCPRSAARVAAQCRRLRAIIPVHLFGQAADMTALSALAARLGVPLIEDAAQAIGATDSLGRAVGSIGPIGCLSFYPTKNLGAAGDAGALTTTDAALAEKLRTLRSHGMSPRYYHKAIGLCSRMDGIQAAVLRVKLRHLDRWTAARQAHAAMYDRLFAAAGAATSDVPDSPIGRDSSSGSDSSRLPVRTPAPVCRADTCRRADCPISVGGVCGRATHVYNQYVIRVPAESRDSLRSYLADRKIGTEIYYPLPLHRQECFASLFADRGGPPSLPVAESCARQSVALPMSAELTEPQIAAVVAAIVSFFAPPGRSV